MRTLIAAILFGAAMPAAAQFAYPATERGNVVDSAFGQQVPDPYRWLENDVRTDSKVKAWVDAQVRVTDAYLATLPARDAFKARLTELWNYERFGVPRKKGGRYFYTRNSGLQNQAALYVRDALDGEPRLLIDPNSWSADGATALASWQPSDDGRYVAYLVQDGGTDWMIGHVLDVATGKVLADRLEWLKFTGLSWAEDGSGFFYSRFPEVSAEQKFQAQNVDQKIYFHRLGTPQAEDRLVYETKDRPTWNHGGTVSKDGKWLVVTSSEGTDDRYEITLIDLARPGAPPRTLVKGLKNNWTYVSNIGGRFFWKTNLGAPRLRLVSMDVAEADPKPVELVAEDAATLEDAELVGDVLLLSYLKDAKTEVRRFTLEGRPAGTVSLPGIGAAAGFAGEPGDPETFYYFYSFNAPTTIYRYDAATNRATPFATPKVAFNPADYQVEQRFYASRDGTRVPMFVVRKKGAVPAGGRPTILYGYGGFNVSLSPWFSTANIAWMERGGVFAVANIRGGGEYGKAWHDGGRLAKKQNVFDDFIAAGEALIGWGVTSREKLAVMGGSNGGLLVGAVVNQRPDLFAAAIPEVGVMDMLRFNQFTAGRYWTDDYGDPAKEADWKVLRAYSPYHNVPATGRFPAVLTVTADTDDRVVPGHSFKYAAALQAAALGEKPRLIRIETRAGHGAGKPTDKIIEEYADIFAFTAKWTGME